MARKTKADLIEDINEILEALAKADLENIKSDLEYEYEDEL